MRARQTQHEACKDMDNMGHTVFLCNLTPGVCQEMSVPLPHFPSKQDHVFPESHCESTDGSGFDSRSFGGTIYLQVCEARDSKLHVICLNFG